MIKIQFPAENKVLAACVGDMLIRYASGVDAPHKTREEHLKGESTTDTREDFSDDGLNDKGEQRKGVTDGDATLSDARVDTKGVPFNEETCANASIPFYASGARKGQWKKRKGVDDSAYDSWYAASLPVAGSTEETTEVDTSSAFGGQSENKPAVDVPKDCGEFMGWVSAQQAAERINQHDINDAYESLGLQVTDLFPPNDAKAISAHVSNLFEKLGGFE